MAFNAKGVMNGTHGSLWINDKEIGEILISFFAR